MKQCPECQQYTADEHIICPTCGYFFEEQTTIQEEVIEPNQEPVNDDLFLYQMIAFIIPIVGILMGFSLKQQKPKQSKQMFIAAMLGVLCSMIVMLSSI